MGQTHDFPFGIMDVVDRLHLNIRRPSPRGFYVDCHICNDKRGKMHVNVQNDTWRCNYCMVPVPLEFQIFQETAAHLLLYRPPMS